MKKNSKYLLLLIIFSLSIGFAVLSANLFINSTLQITKSSFSVIFNLVEVTDTNTVNPTYSINEEGNQITFKVDLDKPGDYIDLSFQVENTGTIDAALENLTVEGISSEYIDYSLTYYDGTTPTQGDLLRSGTIKRLKLHIEYKYDIENFIDIEELNATVNLNYKQPQSLNEKVWDFDYQDQMQTFIAKKAGNYKIETWGAQGGTAVLESDNSNRGYGGYSVGEVSLKENEKLYLAVGGSGRSGSQIDLPKTYNGGGASSATKSYGSVASSGGGGTSVFEENSVGFVYGIDLSNGDISSSSEAYQKGKSLVITKNTNYHLYKGLYEAKPLNSFYKVEWRGEGLDNPKIVYDGGTYNSQDTEFENFNTKGVKVYAQRISNNIAEIYYQVLEENLRTEFRLETNGAPITVHSKTVISLDNPLIVSGVGGGAHMHWNGKSYAGSGGGYIGGSSVNIYQKIPENCAPSTGGTQENGGTLGIIGSEVGQNGLKGLGVSYIYTDHSYGSGGGGGYFGGASGQNGNSCSYSGGGGSGYIANTRLTNKEMYCYNCSSLTDSKTKTTSTTNVSSTPTSKYAKIGNRHIRITYLG